MGFTGGGGGLAGGCRGGIVGGSVVVEGVKIDGMVVDTILDYGGASGGGHGVRWWRG